MYFASFIWRKNFVSYQRAVSISATKKIFATDKENRFAGQSYGDYPTAMLTSRNLH